MLTFGDRAVLQYSMRICLLKIDLPQQFTAILCSSNRRGRGREAAGNGYDVEEES